MKSIINSIDKGFYRKLFAIGLPIAFENFMLSLVGASDAIMLGAIEQSALSAVSLAGQVQFVQILFIFAIVIGASMFTAQYWGKGDKAAVEMIFAFVFKLSFVISIIFWLASAFFPTYIMRFFTSEYDLIQKGAEYLRVVGLSYLFVGLSEMYLCTMKNCGKAFISMVISSVSVVMNIILNAILIFGYLGTPRMGIAGAALATVVSKGFELGWLIVLSYKKNGIRLKTKYLFSTNKQLRKDFWKHSLPVFGNQMVWGIGFTMYSVIMGHLGNDAVAANSIANIAKNLISSFCLGLGNGGSIIIGNILGSGNLEEAKRYGGKVCKMAIFSGIITGGVLLALIPVILHFTNLSEQATEYLKWMLVMCSYYLVGKSINATTIPGIFCAGGDSKFGFICDAITMWAVTVPLGFYTAFVLRLPVLAVYFVLTLDEIVKLPAVYRHYKKYGWVRDLTKNLEQEALVS